MQIGIDSFAAAISDPATGLPELPQVKPSRKNPTRKVKGATVNREMAYLRCLLNFGIERKYISENLANRVRPSAAKSREGE